jgi:hypothetical protein
VNARTYDDDDSPDDLGENEFAGDDTYVDDELPVLDDDETDLEENDFRGDDTYVAGVLDDEDDDFDDEDYEED